MKTIVINGLNFQTMVGLYAEIDRVLTKDLDFETGHNLNAFNDILCGGFGVHEYDDPIRLIWKNFEKSKSVLGEK